MAFAGPLVAQPLAPRPYPSVPAAMDVAGLHLVLSEEAQRLVQQKADGLSRHQPSFQARVALADASFPIIDRVLREEGVPLDFRYLALQESALQGDARSNHEAVGYWQLKQETAIGLGLVVNEAVDERQHLAASTRAAARYLVRSNTSLHNWLDALLSYYTGLGGVKPYTLPTDFDATEMAITADTSPYVLMFLAQKVAFEPACGLNPRPALRLQEFPAVADQTLAAQAQTLHVEPATLAAHNHWLLAATVPGDRPYTLIVPVGDLTQAAGIAANQRLQSRGQLLNAPAVAANTAEVRINNLRALIALPGETTADLARRAHQRLGEFLKHNELTAFDVAMTGRPYYLESKRDAAAVAYHVLQPSENIFDVAQKYGMRQKIIYSKNRMTRVEELRPGRLLWLQHTRPREVAVEYRSLPEGAALERPTATAISTGNDELVEQLNETIAARQTESSEVVKVKIKVKRDGSKTKRVVTEEADGWGEALSTANATATPVPAPAPVVAAAPAPIRPSAPKTTYLPPPTPAPAPAPLADEPRQPDSTAAAPAATRPAVVFRSAPTPPEPLPMPAAAPKAMPAKVVASVPSYPVAAAPKPLPVPTSASVVAAKPAAPVARPTGSEATHVVAPHESVYSIARLYNIPPATLIALNQLAPPAGLTIGQVLLVRAPAPVAPAPAAAPKPAVAPAGRANAALYVPKTAAPTMAGASAPAIQHTVAVGETLYSISKLYRVTVADLQAWNGKAAADNSAKIGEVLRVLASGK